MAKPSALPVDFDDAIAPTEISRRSFSFRLAALLGLPLLPWDLIAAESASSLPMGAAPEPLDFAWFPSRLHAFVWRNWMLVPPARMAKVIGAKQAEVVRLGASMGLKPGGDLTETERRRASLTIIRRNWHLLTYEQLLGLLGWNADEMAYALREDDFLFHKLGRLKPKAAPLTWSEPDAAQVNRATEIRKLVELHFGAAPGRTKESLFGFVDRLSRAPEKKTSASRDASSQGPLRLGYSYFALYGDPLIDPTLDSYPDGYLARLAESGVNAVWLQGVLSHLSSLPWATDPNIAKRRRALKALVERAAQHGIRVFLYLNEPRSLPKSSGVFAANPEWRGVEEEDFNAVCTSVEVVRKGIRDGIADLCRAVPGLGGFFSISGSENLTSCWSHGRGNTCPRCQKRRPAEVIAEVNATFHEGISAAGGSQRMIAWDWGWNEAWAGEVIALLPKGVELMSVSEWGLPIERGGVKSNVGEYCLSVAEPGPRAKKHWAAARKRGLSVMAKMQIGTTWEMSAVPYIPAVDHVCRHVAVLKELGVESMMLGWTLGGHPSPNIDAVAEISAGGSIESLARRRHGEAHAAAMVTFWKQCSAAFAEFPFNITTVYNAPLQLGPANPLWPKPTGYKSSMVGFPYDDLASWRAIYPADVFAGQLDKVAGGMERAVATLRSALASPGESILEQLRFAEVAAIHFASVANQTRFVVARSSGNTAEMKRLTEREQALALRLYALQMDDTRIGFEASNQHFYVPLDLVEKVINCQWVARMVG